MEDLDGFLKHQKTKILPLRWFANLCEKVAHYYLLKALYRSENKDKGFVFKCQAILSNLFYKPYMRWGTYYELVTHSESLDS